MGLDLRLLPFDCDQGDFCFSHTLFECGQDYDLFDKIKELPQLEVPRGFTSYSGHVEKSEYNPCYGKTLEDPYGDAVKYVLAKDLLKLKLDPRDRVSRAAWAYLKELDPYTKVALYWH